VELEYLTRNGKEDNKTRCGKQNRSHRHDYSIQRVNGATVVISDWEHTIHRRLKTSSFD
jgi:hypothetical protein